MRSFTPLLLLSTLLPLAQGCKACFAPSLPSPTVTKTDTEEPDSDAETGETGDSTPTDTTPPPPCDVPEVESNNNPNDPQDLALDQWACGTFDSTVDPESFGFSLPQADWLRVEVRAASIGSEADVSLNLFEPDGEYSAAWYGSDYSSDPFIMFKSDQARDFVAVLSDAYYGNGEDWFWELMATVTKPPVTWTAEEVEPNNYITEPTPITLGESTYGTISSSSDLDWFSVNVPDADKHTLRIRVYAARYGSPADLHLIAYDAEGDWAASALTGEDVYDRDPWKDVTTDMAGDWTFLIREDYSHGSPIYWYTVVVELDPAGTE